MKYLICSTDVYRVDTIEEVEKLHKQLLADNNFELLSFGYKTKNIKQKGEVVEEWQLVTAKKLFNEEKEPISHIDINYSYPEECF